MIETYKTIIETAFQNAENNISKITNDIILLLWKVCLEQKQDIFITIY